MATQNEIAAFEGFKFNVGDRVVHKSTPKPDTGLERLDAETWATAPTAIVLGRILYDGGQGIERCYRIRGAFLDMLLATEIEIERI